MAKAKPIPAGRHAKQRGKGRMKEMGYLPVELYLDAREREAINRASRKDGKRLATWIREMAYLVACGAQYTRP